MHFRSVKLNNVTEWSDATEQILFWTRGCWQIQHNTLNKKWKVENVNQNDKLSLTLHEFGGTRSCVISPAWTQKRCNKVPLYKSQRQTAKSTPPDSKCDLSYLIRGNEINKHYNINYGTWFMWFVNGKLMIRFQKLPWMSQRWTK